MWLKIHKVKLFIDSYLLKLVFYVAIFRHSSTNCTSMISWKFVRIALSWILNRTHYICEMHSRKETKVRCIPERINVVDGSDVFDASDAVDASGVIDASVVDASDLVNDSDVIDGSDVVDASGVIDASVADASDVVDGSDVFDASNVIDGSDVVDGSDVIDVRDAEFADESNKTTFFNDAMTVAELSDEGSHHNPRVLWSDASEDVYSSGFSSSADLHGTVVDIIERLSKQ